MTYQSALLGGEAFRLIRDNMPGFKAQAQNALLSMQAGPVDSNFIYRTLDQAAAAIVALNTWRVTPNLDTYATSLFYPGSLAADCLLTVTALQNYINAVVAAFPTSGGFALDNTLSAVDGSRAARQFTPAQTTSSNLQSTLAAVVASIV